MSAYYNENDKFAAAWLRELIKARLIADGEVDERSIEDVVPSDLTGFTQCHFFAGIGGWSYALRLAGWPDAREVWTGSCPCQPFSAAGKRKGAADERHLWPAWFHLISECRPGVIFGEQVEAAIKQGWLDLVQDDLEGIGYAVAPHGLAACNLGAPHQRKRLYFVAHSQQRGRYDGRGLHRGCSEKSSGIETSIGSELRFKAEGNCTSNLMADLSSERCGETGTSIGRSEERISNGGESCILADSSRPRINGSGDAREGRRSESPNSSELGDTIDKRLQGYGELGRKSVSADGQGTERHSSASSFWSNCDWLPCRDSKSRPVEPSTFPLAHGVPARVGRLRGYGNAIVPQVAQAFIESYLEVVSGN